MKKKQNKKANTILEFAIVATIVAGVVAASIGVSKSVFTGSETKITKERMEVVYEAIKNYVATHKRLPCPASLQAAKGSENYGVEAPDNGSCDDLFDDGLNLVYGMIPIDVLNLNADMAEDGHGTKFSYVIDKRFTKTSLGTSGSDGFELTKSSPSEADVSDIDLGMIDIQSPLGSSIITNSNVIFTLISHGPNKFSGFDSTRITRNSAGTNLGEISNSSESLNKTFVSSSTDGFDDILIFKTKSQLVRDAGLENIMCNNNESASGGLCSGGSWSNANYGERICLVGAGVCSKKCGKYGVWSSSYEDLMNCDLPEGCVAEITTHSTAINGEITANWQQAALGSNVYYSLGGGGYGDVESGLNAADFSSSGRSNGYFLLKRSCSSAGQWGNVEVMCASGGSIGNANYGSSGDSNSIASGSNISATSCINNTYWKSGDNNGDYPIRQCVGNSNIDKVYYGTTISGTADCQVKRCAHNFSSHGYNNVTTTLGKGLSGTTIYCQSGKYSETYPFSNSSVVSCNNNASNPQFSTPPYCKTACNKSSFGFDRCIYYDGSYRNHRFYTGNFTTPSVVKHNQPYNDCRYTYIQSGAFCFFLSYSVTASCNDGNPSSVGSYNKNNCNGSVTSFYPPTDQYCTDFNPAGPGNQPSSKYITDNYCTCTGGVQSCP